MEILSIKTRKPREVVDITGRVNEAVGKSAIEDAVCFLFITHTTAALGIADLDPGTDQDMLDAFEAMMPKLRYRHPHDPEHVTEHILATLLGPSVLVPVRKNKLMLGTWQSIVLFEFSGARERQVTLSFIKEAK